jgi:uncharacterized protein (DUF2141 family)
MTLRRAVSPVSLAVASTLILGAPARAATVSATVGDIEPNGTYVYANLCDKSLDPTVCKHGTRARASGATMVFEFIDVPPGRYAFLAFQDIHDTGTLERTPMGLPLVPFALSNNAGRSRRPTFEQAAFPVGPEGAAITVRLRALVPSKSATP